MQGASSVKTRRWATAGLAVAASLTFATAACGTTSNETSTPTTSAIPANPKDALVASAQELQKTTFTFKLTGAGVTGSGSVDAPADSATMKAKFSDQETNMTFAMEFLILAEDRYMKLDFGSLPIPGLPPKDKWQHIDLTKVKDPKSLDLDVATDADPAGAKTIFDSIVTAEKTGDKQYKGTVDISAIGKDADLLDADVVKDLGPDAKTVPFEATLDDQGRLTNLKLQIPAKGKVKAQVWEITYSDYGSAPKLEKPSASEAQEAPKGVYDLINS
jgi:hypothetical protein